MADQFSNPKSVPDVRHSAKLPTLERQVTADIPQFPDVAGAFRELATTENSLGALGAHVAQQASNTLAQQLGYETGKNPKGDLLPSLTEFDQNFTKSYQEQAGATLSLQANKLLTDAQIELSKAPRLTPGLIQKSNDQLHYGLAKIASNAPTAIKGKLESNFASDVLNINAKLQEKMIRDNREDQKNTIINSLDLNLKNAFELARNGDNKGAMNLIETNKQLASSALNSRFLNKEQARVYDESIEQAVINGRYINRAMDANTNGKLEEYEKNVSKGPQEGETQEQWVTGVQAMYKQIKFINDLKNQNAQLEMANFRVKLLERPNDITPQEMLSLKENVSPIQWATMQGEIIKAKQKADKDSEDNNTLASHWGDSDAHAQSSESIKKGAFRQLVKASQQLNPNLSRAEAEMNVVIQSGGPVQEYIDTINGRLTSGDPKKMEESLIAIERIYDANKGDNIQGLSSKAVAMGEVFAVLRQSKPLIEAAQTAKQIVYGKNKEQYEANDQAWSDYLKTNIGTGETHAAFFLKKADLSKDTFIRNAQAYTRQFEQIFETFYKLTNGDAEIAEKILKRYIDTNYGYSVINGVKEFTYLPVAKTLGLNEEDNGVIQSDVAYQLSELFDSTNKAFNEGKSDWKWYVKPLITIEDAMKHLEIPKAFEGSKVRQQGQTANFINKFNSENKVQVVKIYRDGRTENYEAVLQANPYSAKTKDPRNPVIGGWDIMLGTKQGQVPIYTLDPKVATAIYHPRVDKIKADIWALKQPRISNKQVNYLGQVSEIGK